MAQDWSPRSNTMSLNSTTPCLNLPCTTRLVFQMLFSSFQCPCFSWLLSLRCGNSNVLPFFARCACFPFSAAPCFLFLVLIPGRSHIAGGWNSSPQWCSDFRRSGLPTATARYGGSYLGEGRNFPFCCSMFYLVSLMVRIHVSLSMAQQLLPLLHHVRMKLAPVSLLQERPNRIWWGAQPEEQRTGLRSQNQTTSAEQRGNPRSWIQRSFISIPEQMLTAQPAVCCGRALGGWLWLARGQLPLGAIAWRHVCWEIS